MNKKDQLIEKREKILEVALEEFALNSYKSASTNSICKKAGVSKGLLYHYYNTKQELYLCVLDSFLNEFKINIKINIDNSDKKGVEYISEYFNTKFKFFSENVLYSRLLTNVILNPTTEEEKNFIQEFEGYNNNLIYEVIKNIKLNPKYEVDKVFELIVMIGEKLEEKHMKNLGDKTAKEALQEFRKDHKLMIEMIFEGVDL